MTADRVALEDKVVQMFKNGPDWAYSPRDIATAAINLIRDEVLEEAAVIFSRYADDPFAASVVADHLRRMKRGSSSGS